MEEIKNALTQVKNQIECARELGGTDLEIDCLLGAAEAAAVLGKALLKRATQIDNAI